MRITSPKFITSLPLIGLLAACGTSEPQVSPSPGRSTDPILMSVMSSFERGCIDNAPEFNSAQIRAAFSQNQPRLAPGMSFLASGEPGRSCKVKVLNYGTDRAKPTVGDVNALGRALQSRIGGSFKPKSPNRAGGAEIKLNRSSYDVFGYVGNKGHLSFSVFE